MSDAVQNKTYNVLMTPDDVNGGFAAMCYELNVFSRGETHGELMDNMQEAMELASKEIGNADDSSVYVIQVAV